ncbi:hypothetical protein QAD02_014407 [Eretmocerus hayati]|uniref:Uncharacterized protein n=1 Tax=Eretmocerus hayati TaxID=131215 RepID=A0ACC2P5F4_9HYME|nr:hypothetical protein QAD02_014407 [Eretmocerus hayati]
MFRGDRGIQIVKDQNQSPHEHPSNRESAQAPIVVRRLKIRARGHPELTPSAILRHELPDIDQAVLSHHPERKSPKEAMRRKKRQILPETLRGELFLLDDFKTHNDLQGSRVIALASRKGPELLAASKTWSFDVTFRVCPKIFSQIFTVY